MDRFRYLKDKEKMINWEIHSHHYNDQVYCNGTTVFEPAIGGKGCKLTFSGMLEWKGKVLSTGIDMLDNTIARAAETVLSQMIPANLRKIAESNE